MLFRLAAQGTTSPDLLTSENRNRILSDFQDPSTGETPYLATNSDAVQLLEYWLPPRPSKRAHSEDLSMSTALLALAKAVQPRSKRSKDLPDFQASDSDPDLDEFDLRRALRSSPAGSRMLF